MRKAVLTILLSLMIGFASLAYANTRFAASAWQEACELSRYKCEGVAPPLVEYDETGLASGLLGYYLLGTRIVFISAGQEEQAEYAVMVHEMVHYLQYMTATRVGGLILERCSMEREAFEISDQVLKRLGLGEQARNGNLIDYGC